MSKIKLPASFLVAILFLSIPVFSQQTSQVETLNNYSIMNMVKKGLSQSIILLKIKNTPSNFDVSTDALIFLKDNKVNDEIVLAMVEKSSKKSVSASQKNEQVNNSSISTNLQESAQSDNKESNPEAEQIIENLNGSGIYYYNVDLKTYTQVDQTVVSGSESKISTGNYFGIPSGVVNKNYIDGNEANMKITETTQPVFYFYFDPASTSLNNSNNKTGQQPSNYLEALYGFSFQQNAKAFTPNDFKLIRLDLRKNSRMFKGGRNSFGMGMGKIPSGYFVTFKYERLSNNLFKVYFPKPLPNLAQFCFLYAGNTGNKGLANPYSSSEIKVFDFGTEVKRRKK
jgi:hypothetical protein